MAELPDFSPAADKLRQVGGKEGIFVSEQFHRGFVTTKNIERLNS